MNSLSIFVAQVIQNISRFDVYCHPLFFIIASIA
jgi:hypothetical protein